MAKKAKRPARKVGKRTRPPSKPPAARPPVTLSQAAYARHRGVSREAVNRAIREGRIPVGANGRINPAEADAAWERNTTPRPDAHPAPALAGGDTEPMSLNEARTRHESAKAKLAELELGERSGQLIPVSEMRDVAFRASRAARDLLQSIPDRVAEVLLGQTDANEIRRLLHDEIGRAVDELASVAPEEEPPAAREASA